MTCAQRLSVDQLRSTSRWRYQTKDPFWVDEEWTGYFPLWTEYLMLEICRSPKRQAQTKQSHWMSIEQQVVFLNHTYKNLQELYTEQKRKSRRGSMMQDESVISTCKGQKVNVPLSSRQNHICTCDKKILFAFQEPLLLFLSPWGST